MALAERDQNKRKRVQIDLTEDSDDSQDLDAAPRKKVQKAAVDKNASTRQSSQGSIPTTSQKPPHGSAPRSSQPTGPSRYESVYNSFGSHALASTQHSHEEREAWLAVDDEDVFATVNSTQAAAAGNDDLFHYGEMSAKVVGVQYYRGHASQGEQILMRREPGNHSTATPFASTMWRVYKSAIFQEGSPRSLLRLSTAVSSTSKVHWQVR